MLLRRKYIYWWVRGKHNDECNGAAPGRKDLIESKNLYYQFDISVFRNSITHSTFGLSMAGQCFPIIRALPLLFANI